MWDGGSLRDAASRVCVAAFVLATSGALASTGRFELEGVAVVVAVRAIRVLQGPALDLSRYARRGESRCRRSGRRLFRPLVVVQADFKQPYAGDVND